MKKDRKKQFEMQQDLLVSKFVAELTTLKNTSPKAKKEISDLEAKIEIIQGWAKSFEDEGPVYDVFLIYEEEWKVGVYVPPIEEFNPEKKPE